MSENVPSSKIDTKQALYLISTPIGNLKDIIEPEYIEWINRNIRQVGKTWNAFWNLSAPRN